MRKKTLSVLALLLALYPIFAMSDDVKFSYSVLSEKNQQRIEKNGDYPFEENALKLAKKEKTIRFYCMHMDQGSSVTKWGDATLIVFPNEKVMLIDAGISEYGETLVKNLKALGIKQIDYLVLSHNHPDHFGGIFAKNGILANYHVVNFYWNGLNCDYNASQSQNFNNGMRKYANMIDNVYIIKAGDRIDLGDDIFVDVYNPSEQQKKEYLALPEGLMSEKMNSESLALLITYKEFKALFCGDLYKDREEELIKIYGAETFDVDLVKFNHHGKDTSNGQIWANATTPRVVVGMYGYNFEGSAYEHYASTGAYVFHEQVDGYIRVVTDGLSYCNTTRSKTRQTKLYLYYDMQAQKIYPPEK
jgi:competence protein ComEC